MQFTVERIGRSQTPIVVIDEAWPEPGQLVELAASRTDYATRALYYPGIRSEAPREYVYTLLRQLSSLISTTFAVGGELRITDATYSIVTTPADRLVPFQRVPHFDSAEPNRFAILHYLTRGSIGGGTSFYRHRASGLEVIDAIHHDAYIAQVNKEVAEHGMPPAAYPDADTHLFERIARFDAVFNRILVYPGNILHSVTVPENFVPDPNPRTGRLTLNTFVRAETQA